VRDVPTWQLQEAKAKFSELFRRVRAEGPQRVTKHGGEAVVIVAAEVFERNEELAKQPESLADFFADAPTGGRGLEVERKRDVTRDIEW
jgi:prevent-host-death family protein